VPASFKKIVPALALLLVIPSIILNIFFLRSQNSSVSFSGYPVITVIDGDTFITADKSIVRFDTLDAPELEFCGGSEAKEALEKLILGKNVRLDSQVRDINGRQIASVWMGDTWVDQKLLETGWVAYSSSTVDKDHLLKNLDLANRQKQIGIYSPKCTQYQNHLNPKCNIKGNISGEWLKRGQKLYHLPGCVQYNTVRVELYRGEQWFCTQKEAQKAGYTKSARCP